MVLGLSGALLAIDPVQQAWQAPAAAPGLPVATLVQRVQAGMPGVEEIRRLPTGRIAAFGFAGEQAQALYVDPADGRLLGPYQPSSMPRWVKDLHRALLLGDAGRWGAAGVALAMALLSVSGLVLLLLCLSSATALVMSATTLGLVTLEAGPEPEVVSTAGSAAPLPPEKIPLLQDLRVGDLRRLNLPDAADPTDTWSATTRQGQGWIDRYSGQSLAWQDATTAQRIDDWARVLHTGESAWPWAVVLGLSGLSVLLFWVTGVLIWWQGRQAAVRIADNSAPQQADVLVFVASEGGSTWGFAQALHGALVRAGHRVHSTGLEHFRSEERRVGKECRSRWS